jgi:hypothetical protein
MIAQLSEFFSSFFAQLIEGSQSLVMQQAISDMA